MIRQRDDKTKDKQLEDLLAEKTNQKLKELVGLRDPSACHVLDGNRGGRSSIDGMTSGARPTWTARHRCATS